MSTSDETLATLTLNGDIDAFEVLLARYQKMVFKVGYRMMGQREEAEDIVQDFFLTIYSKMNQFNPQKKCLLLALSHYPQIPVSAGCEAKRTRSSALLMSLPLILQTAGSIGLTP